MKEQEPVPDLQLENYPVDSIDTYKKGRKLRLQIHELEQNQRYRLRQRSQKNKPFFAMDFEVIIEKVHCDGAPSLDLVVLFVKPEDEIIRRQPAFNKEGFMVGRKDGKLVEIGYFVNEEMELDDFNNQLKAYLEDHDTYELSS